MIYLTIFWAILIVFILVYYSSKIIKNKKLNQFIDREGALFFIGLLIPLVLIAIITKDPVTFGSFEIPVELQWLGSLFVSFFGAWQFYLKPLKNKLYLMNREIGQVKSKLDSMDSDLKIIKDVLIKRNPV